MIYLMGINETKWFFKFAKFNVFVSKLFNK